MPNFSNLWLCSANSTNFLWRFSSSFMISKYWSRSLWNFKYWGWSSELSEIAYISLPIVFIILCLLLKQGPSQSSKILPFWARFWQKIWHFFYRFFFYLNCWQRVLLWFFDVTYHSIVSIELLFIVERETTYIELLFGKLYFINNKEFLKDHFGSLDLILHDTNFFCVF